MNIMKGLCVTVLPPSLIANGLNPMATMLSANISPLMQSVVLGVRFVSRLYCAMAGVFTKQIRYMITIYILTSEFGSSPCCDRNNPQWLRKQEKEGGEVFASPLDSCVANYFHESFIKPLLDNGGYIKEEFWGIPITTSDGISYCIKKWRENQHKESFT